MKKPVLIIILVLLISGAAGAFYLWQNLQKDPVQAARAFLSQLEAEDFSVIDSYFSAAPHPRSEEMRQAFARFGQAFGLTGMSVPDLTLLSKDSTAAVFNLTMRYE